MNEIVSILIPAYNAGEFLLKCLDSVVNQTYQYLQVVVVDDGSKDNTLELAQSYADKYSFLEVYHQENAGVAVARNKLISLAKGDYVLFVDSDDWIELDMIERMLNLMKKNKADIVSCGYLVENNNSSLHYPFVDKAYLLEGTENVMKAILLHKELNGSLCNKIVRKKFYEGLTFHKDIWYGEDCLFFWQALRRGVQCIYFTPECFYHYRMNDGSISHEEFNYKKISGHEVWKQMCEDTQIMSPALAHLGEIVYVISDMWLLYYAARSNYPRDKYIKEFQLNVRTHFISFFLSDIINYKKKLFGMVVAMSYSLGGLLLRLLKL